MTVCRSGAWGAKMVTSAWWVYADQVKTSFVKSVDKCMGFLEYCSTRREKHAARFWAAVSLRIAAWCIACIYTCRGCYSTFQFSTKWRWFFFVLLRCDELVFWTFRCLCVCLVRFRFLVSWLSLLAYSIFANRGHHYSIRS